MRTRKSVYELNDDTLIWYSKAVDAMKAKDVNDPLSWWYQGGIHGYNPNRSIWQSASGFPPTTATTNSGYWRRCQHGTWYFLPWHRMYLYCFEEIVAQTIVDLGGPSDWALPYWNYCEAFDPNLTPAEQRQALNIPPEFGSSTGAAPNSPGLWISSRNNYTLRQVNVNPRQAMQELSFTNSSSGVEFGGGVTGFSHSGNRTGQLESLPHNVVHVNIGGAMGDPATAGLDPIFWLHHANIDRLWEVWLNKQQRQNPATTNWLNFTFNFHDASSNPVQMAVRDVERVSQLNYTYTVSYPEAAVAPVIPLTPPTPQPPTLLNTPTLLPASPNPTAGAMDVVGASSNPLFISGEGSTSTVLTMVPEQERNVRLTAKSISSPLPVAPRSVLKISNVTGKGQLPPLNIFINSKNTDPNKDAQNFVGSIGLFGLEQASTPSVECDGSGLNFVIDVSDTIEHLRAEGNWDEESINIQIVPQEPVEGDASSTIGRVSLHSELVQQSN